eukprot:7210382-Pyramimonas_sp.AAC.3
MYDKYGHFESVRWPYWPYTVPYRAAGISNFDMTTPVWFGDDTSTSCLDTGLHAKGSKEGMPM